MESKRLLVAIALSVAVIVLYEMFVARYFAPPPAPRAPGPQVTTPAAPAPAGAPAPAAPAAPAPGAAPGAAPDGEMVRVRTADVEARFSTAGAALVDVRLLRYRTSLDPESPPVDLATVPGGAFVPEVGRADGASQGQPLLPPGTLFRVEPASGLVVEPGRQGTLTFSAEAPGGLRVVNRYVFDGTGYAFRLEQSITGRGGGPAVVRPAWVLRHARDAAAEKATGYATEGLVRVAGKVRRTSYEDLTQPDRTPGPLEWAGWDEKYFAGVIVPRGAPVESVVLAQGPALSGAAGDADAPGAQVGPAGPVAEVRLLYGPATVAPGGAAGVAAQVYLGPKEVGALRAVDPTLEQVIHFGFFHWIAMPLLLVLRWLYGFVANYGVAIILLTVLVKLVFWPLTQKQIKSAKAMAKVQPLIQQIREKHKNDRERMNQEMMELFRRHNVNPLMGCLPLVVQIPVFFALYQVLNGSIELRHAPFVGWIRDLSAMDPYYVTPVLMGVTMFVTQKMTPAPGMDPMQQKLMLLMPAVMSVFFLWMPSGLVLYWLVMNVLQIGQQVYTNRLSA